MATVRSDFDVTLVVERGRQDAARALEGEGR
jgi:hypothetical protein